MRTVTQELMSINGFNGFNNVYSLEFHLFLEIFTLITMNFPLIKGGDGQNELFKIYGESRARDLYAMRCPLEMQTVTWP